MDGGMAEFLKQPKICLECQSKGPFTVNVEQTKYRSLQKITIQEAPGSVEAGSTPRAKEAMVFGEMVF